MSDDIYEVYAIAYAHVDRQAADNFVGGDPHNGPMPLNYYVWAMVGSERTVILDTGFEERSANLRKRTLTKPLHEGLAAIGIDPAKVEDVVLSHLHYDHCGNNALFPNARFHLQDSEMAFATGRSMCHGLMSHGYDLEDVLKVVRSVYEGRVDFHDGSDELFPGISVHHIGGHTRGLQSVRVKTRRGFVVLASDATHHYAHFMQRRVFPIVHDVHAALEGYRTLERLATSQSHVIPGHDPLVASIYPAAKAGTEGWIMRLDLEPKPLPED